MMQRTGFPFNLYVERFEAPETNRILKQVHEAGQRHFFQ